ncbi:hypothetical protein ACFOGJ_11750 [Marinibaculum pumilum]|uniref:Helix-turn-helix domain-containing protein n=1 Tax=Marinibaculum pumilum TaxID=1766165 RepID=A0ABV7L0K2_9PROT
MDSLINAAARALAAGDPLGALNRIALRDDPPALALRGIAMAQLDDLPRARALLRAAARAFGPREAVARARCTVAEAEIALVSRDLAGPAAGKDGALDAAATLLAARGDAANAGHARYLAARRLLLIGRLDEAARRLDAIDPVALPPASRAGLELVAAGIAMRRLQAEAARTALARAATAADRAGIPALVAEVQAAARAFAAPAARLVSAAGDRPLLTLAEVEALLATDALVVDACRHAVRGGGRVVALGRRPVLFALARVLAEAWPGDASREALLARAFHAKAADESHRARLRVEIGRLRAALRGLSGLSATKRGFVLQPQDGVAVAVLAPPVEETHAALLACLADGEAWSSSALALALGNSQRKVQRALEALAAEGKVQAVGGGRARRWTATPLPGFPTALLLPGAPLHG